MKLVRGGAKATVTTDWVSVANISGSGTDIVSSAVMQLGYNALPDFAGLSIEVEFTHQRTNATDYAVAWVHLQNVQFNELFATENQSAAHQYTGIILTIAQRTRRVLVGSPITQQSRSAVNAEDVINVRVQSRGYTGTDWETTNIRARLRYTPI